MSLFWIFKTFYYLLVEKPQRAQSTQRKAIKLCARIYTIFAGTIKMFLLPT